MSELARAQEAMDEAQRLAAVASAELAEAYRAVFDGTPTRDHQAMVLADLAEFCGMRTALLRPTFHETAEAVGKFRVWQRLEAFRAPRSRRPADARRGGNHGQAQDDGSRPIAGGGVAEPTVD